MIALRGGMLCGGPGQGGEAADLYLRDGAIAAILPAGAPPPAGEWEQVDCSGLLVMPGPVDTLCRLSLAPDPWREDVRTLAAAAAAGGYTAVLAYTGSAEPAAIASLREAQDDLPVRVHPVAALTREGRLAELGLLADAGAVAFSDWPAPVTDARLMRRALEYAGWLGRTVVARAEDADLAAGGVMHEGALCFAMGLRGVPAVAETIAVQRDVALQRAFGGRLHLAALSAAGSLELLGAASASVTAHHLALTEGAVHGYATEAKLSPPLRGETDRAALVAAARAGRLCLASGHDPRPPEDKLCEYDYAAFGATALETAPALALEVLGADAFVQAAAQGPARAFGLRGGALAPGAPADVAVFDPKGDWVVRPEALRSRGRSTPLAGRRLGPRAVLTVCRGRLHRLGRVVTPA